MLITHAIIFLAPLVVAAAVGMVTPESIRLHAIIAAYLFASVVSVSVASERHHGRIATAGQMMTAVRNGSIAAGWIGFLVGGVIAAAWIASHLT